MPLTFDLSPEALVSLRPPPQPDLSKANRDIRRGQGLWDPVGPPIFVLLRFKGQEATVLQSLLWSSGYYLHNTSVCAHFRST